jgi:ProQ/FINO family
VFERIGRKDTRMASSKDFRLARPAVVVRKRAAKPVVPAVQPPAPATSTTPLPPPVTTHGAAPVPRRSAPAAPPPTAQKPPAARKLAAARVQPAPPLPVPSRPEAQPQPATRPAEDPDSSAAQRQQRKQAVKALLTILTERWPQTFAAYPTPVRPLATGIDRDLAAALPEQSRRHIRFAITWWQRVRGPAYWQALLQGGPRYDLAGQPRGAVTPAQQERARQELAAWQAQRRGRAGRTRRRSNPPDGPTPNGEQTVTRHIEETLYKKE